MFRILWWLFKEVGKEIIIGSVANAVLGGGGQSSAPQYQISRDYPAQEQTTTEAQAQYYASRFKRINDEEVTENELLGSYYGNRNGKFEVFTISKVQIKSDTLFFKYIISDSNLDGIENVGYVLPKKNVIDLQLAGVKPCAFYIAKCDLNNKKYFVFGNNHEGNQKIEFLSGEK